MELDITAYLGLGSNLGDKQANLKESIEHLNKTNNLNVSKISSVYLTEPMGVTRQPDFYNMVVQVKTLMTPLNILKRAKEIEYTMGRQPNSHFKPRPIDIDILLFGDSEIDTLELLIPHSRLTKRAFVLTPILELEPELIHPTSFKPLKEYLGEIADSQKVERIIDAGDFAGKPQKG